MKQKKVTKCPVCGVSVKTNNLAGHLQRVHNRTIDNGVLRERASANPPMVDTGNGQVLDITACDEALEKGARLMTSKRFKRAINVFGTIPEEVKENAEKVLTGIKELLELELANKPGINQETYFELEERYEKAEKHLKKSLDIDPSYKPASINYRALKKLKEKIKKDPEYLAKIKDKLMMGHF